MHCTAVPVEIINTGENCGINLNTFAYDIKHVRVQSSLLNIRVHADKILDISPQTVSGIAAGDWVFLKPSVLHSGNHESLFHRR
jgi:hypothetical protein